MSDLKQKSINAIIWNLIEKYGIQIVSLVIGVILARLLTPADYGLIGMISVFFALALVFVNSGFGVAYIQKKDADEEDASTIFFFNIFVSILFYFVLWFSAPLIVEFYNQDQLESLIRISAVVLIINSLGMMQISKLTKEVNFKKKSLISLVSTIISGSIGISAALLDYGVWSLVFQQIAKSLINVVGLWLFYNWRPQLVFKVESLRSMFSFSAWVLLTSLITTIFNNIYILTIGKFFPIAQLGFYTKAKGYQKMVSQQPTFAISSVSFPIFSKLQNDKKALKNSMKKFMQHSVFFIAPISAILIVISDPLILIVLTEKWMPMVPYFQLLLIIGFLYPVNFLNIQLLTAQGMSKLNFKITLIKNSLRILNIIIMYRFGVLHIIYGEVILSFIVLFINGYYTKIYINYGTLEQLKDLYKIYLTIIVVIILGFVFSNLFLNDYLKILTGIFVSGGCYIFFQYFFNKDFFISNINLLKGKPIN